VTTEVDVFKAIVLRKTDTEFSARVELLDESALPAGEVRVRIEYSTVNYKDALAIADRAPVVRKWPMIPGIDLAGTVISSVSPAFQPGDHVILNGWGIGEAHWGGLAQEACVKGDWLVPRPARLSAREAMAIGTAGYTAMLCASALALYGAAPEEGEVLVTGAAGGVGSVAIAILSAWGYKVVASTRRPSEEEYLRRLGAREIIAASSLSAPGKPLGKERWTGVVDTVGSHTLVNACATTRYGGVVTACGLAQGMDFQGTVAPFILRAVRLIGIDSVMAPAPVRRSAWARLAEDLDRGKLDAITHEIALAEVFDAAREILAGSVRGRFVVDVNR
jgi:acrylyl-CoA reductase (NADPH)